MKLESQIFWKYFGYQREDDAWDHKQDISITKKSEFAELAKDIIAFANYGGGYILLGVEDGSHVLTGVTSHIDPSSLGDLIEKRLGFQLDVLLLYFDHEVNGHRLSLGLMYIPPGDKVLMSTRDLHGSDGTLAVQASTIYFRRNTRSIRASSSDIERIMCRLNKGQVDNVVALQHEQSALRKSRPRSDSDFLRVLYGTYEPTAEELGKKLREVWQFNTERSKAEFAELLGILPSEIDDYFEGRKMLGIGNIVVATKLFDLPKSYFFRPTYHMRFAYWMEDVVKYAILSMVRPKAAIPLIDNNSTFYSFVFMELATGICEFHELLYSSTPRYPLRLRDKKTDTPWFVQEGIPENLRRDLERQYYKLLEQYPIRAKHPIIPAEEILRMWFFVAGDYIARLVIEGIDSIEVKARDDFAVKLSFMQDLLKAKVRFKGYNSKNLRMSR